MIRLTTIFLLLICFGASANEISKINKLKKDAEIAFKAGQYDVAISNYSYLIDTLHIDDEQATMNLGHAYHLLNQPDLAQAQYQKLVLSEDEALKSVAYQQLGALSKDPKTLEKSLSYFKESIKSDPSNLDARYNYELVKKKLKEQQNQNQDQDQDDQKDNEDQENKDEEKKDQEKKENEDQQEGDENKDQEQEDQEQQDQENKDQEGEEKEEEQQEGQDEKKEGEEEEQPKPEDGEEGEKDEKEKQQPPSPSDKMQEMQISEEKAKMILEALKNSEVQYIQQNRRKPTKRKDSDKPDW